MTIRWLVPAILVSVSILAAQPGAPCKIIDYRILSPTRVAIKCDSVQIDNFDFQATLSGGAQPLAVRVHGPREKFDSWMLFDLPGPQQLEGNKSYTLQLATTGTAVVAGQPLSGPFAHPPLTISTKPDTALAVPFDHRRYEMVYEMHSKIALDPATAAKAQLYEVVSPALRHGLKFEIAVRPHQGDDPEQAGLAELTILGGGPASLDTRLALTGLRNILGGEVTFDARKTLKLDGAPPSKAAANAYLKLTNQAGPGSKPGWAVDLKFQPDVAAAGHGFFLTIPVTADIGQNKVQGAQVADKITAGMGVTGFVPIDAGQFQGVRFTPQGSFETNREGTKQNLIFDGDAQLFFAGLLASVKDRNFRSYVDQKNGRGKFKGAKANPELTSQDAEQVKVGFQAHFFLGTEDGRPLTQHTVNASSGNESVVVPTYTIARLRPKVDASLEFWRLTLTFNATPRFLITPENVTRQVNELDSTGKLFVHIYMVGASGWRPYGETSLSVKLDAAGHYALCSTYKLGSQPPNFDKINTVQTGITISF